MEVTLDLVMAQKGKIIGIKIVSFSNMCDITDVYLMDGLNYNLLSISQLFDSRYEVKLKKTRCTIGHELGIAILPRKKVW